MITLDDKQKKEFKKTIMLAVSFLLIAPVMYLTIIIFVLQPAAQLKPAQDILLYILIIVALLLPIAHKIVRKVQIINFKNGSQTGMTIASLYTVLSIINFAMVESIYIFGYIAYILTSEMFNYLIFSIIAICWSVISWPRRVKFEKFLTEMEPYGK